MKDVEGDAFSDALHQEMLDMGFARAEAAELVEEQRQFPYWDEVAELWFTQRRETPWHMLTARRIDELRASDYDTLAPSAQLVKFFDAHPGAAAELAVEVGEELVFQRMIESFDGEGEK